MRGTMQDRPLALPHIFHRAERLFAEKRIVEAGRDGDRVTNVAAWAERVRRLAAALDALGLSEDARVGTFGLNNLAHLEAYFAVPLTGRVLHTINIRLSAQHLRFIINHAADEAIIVDRGLLAALWPLVDELPSVQAWIVVEDGSDAAVPDDTRIIDYDTLLARVTPYPGRFEIAHENLACGLCYTSGTTGDPRGVLYSHRSTVLHAMMMMTANSLTVGETDVVLPIVPMFHADAWGLPYAAMFAGASLILPGTKTEPAELVALMAREHVTIGAAATTVWTTLTPLLAKARDQLSLRLVVTGASAASRTLIEAIRDAVGVPLMHSWGMTEISPLAVLGRLRPEDEGGPNEAELRGRQGRPIPLVDLRLAGDLPWDGVSEGEIEVSGPFVTASYTQGEGGGAFTEDGWLRTGDIGSIDAHGYLRIADRLKDIIKSGGEWIPSIQLENAILSHPDVLEVAVIGRPHEKWGERPMAIVVTREDRTIEAATILEHLRPQVAKWWLPDEIVFIDTLPRTATGKVSKVTLRKSFS